MMKNLALGGVSLMFLASIAINIELHTDNVMLKAERAVYFETLKNYNLAYQNLHDQLLEVYAYEWSQTNKPPAPKNLRIVPNPR